MAIDVLRVTSADDFERFRALAAEYEASLPSDLKHSDFARQHAAVAAHFSPPNAAFVAEADGVPAGCVALAVNAAERTAVVKTLYVTPSYRKHGIARLLMNGLIDYARGCGMVRLVLDTARERMQPAYALYLALGFRDCEPYGEVDYRCPTFMDLRIGQP